MAGIVPTSAGSAARACPRAAEAEAAARAAMTSIWNIGILSMVGAIMRPGATRLQALWPDIEEP
jgi:hypothetical protein